VHSNELTAQDLAKLVLYLAHKQGRDRISKHDIQALFPVAALETHEGVATPSTAELHLLTDGAHLWDTLCELVYGSGQSAIALAIPASVLPSDKEFVECVERGGALGLLCVALADAFFAR